MVAYLRGRPGDVGKAKRDRLVEGLALACQFHTASLAQEQATAQVVLQGAHLLADRGLGHSNLVGSPGETQPSRRSLEGPQG